MFLVIKILKVDYNSHRLLVFFLLYIDSRSCNTSVLHNKKFPLPSSMSGGLTISGSTSLVVSCLLRILYRVRTPARRRLKVGQNLIVLTSEEKLVAATLKDRLVDYGKHEKVYRKI